MEEQIIQIAERLRGLRDALDLSIDELIGECGISKEEYEKAAQKYLEELLAMDFPADPY